MSSERGETRPTDTLDSEYIDKNYSDGDKCEKISDYFHTEHPQDDNVDSSTLHQWREPVADVKASDDDDDDDEVFTCSSFAGHFPNNGGRRCYSECSDNGRPSSDGSVQLHHQETFTFRRDRSRSEPTVPPMVDVVSIARELRRVSDEFHSLYTNPRPKPSSSQSSSSGGGSPFSGAGTRLLQNVRDHMLGHHLRPVKRQRSYSETSPPTFQD